MTRAARSSSCCCCSPPAARSATSSRSAGKSLPPPPYGRAEPPTAEELLEPTPEAQPRAHRRAAPAVRRARGRSVRPAARRLSADPIMDHFQLRDGELYAEDVPLARIADEVGTPVYVYSRATLERHARVFREALAAARPRAPRLRGQGQPQPRGAQGDAARGLRRRRRLGRRAGARARRGHAGGGHRLLGRRQAALASWSARSTPGSASSTSNPRKRARSSPRSPPRAGMTARLRAARQSRRRRRHPRQDLDRQGRQQVRRADRRGARRSTPGWPRCPASRCAASRCTSAAS